MRIAIVSDIHGNQTACEAVLADLRGISPDLIFHGGDLAASGATPVEIVDQVRDLGWPGVVGTPMKCSSARVAAGVYTSVASAGISPPRSRKWRS